MRLFVSVVMFIVIAYSPVFAAERGKVVVPSQQHIPVTPKDTSTIKLAMPDLVTESILVSPASPQQNDVIGPVTVKIRNQGSGTASASKAVFGCLGSWCSPMNCSQCSGWSIESSTSGVGWAGKWSVPSLAPGASVQFAFTPPVGGTAQKWAAGSYTFTCTVDRDDAAHEINENNNIKSVGVTVQQK